MCTVDPNRTVSEEKNVCVNCGCVQCMVRYTILMQEGSSFIVTVPEDGELGVFNPRYTYVTLNEGVAAELGMMPQYRYDFALAPRIRAKRVDVPHPLRTIPCQRDRTS